MYLPKVFSSPSGSMGTLGSAMKQAAERLKTIRSNIGNKWSFRAGSGHDLKLVKCVGCGEESCYYIGGGPKDIECLNENCEFFRLPPSDGGKRYYTGWEKPYETDHRNDYNKFYMYIDWAI